MPRVIQITNRFVISGPVINAVNLTRYLSPEFETIIVAGGKETHEKEAFHLLDGLNIRTINDMRRDVGIFSNMSSYYALKKIIKEFRPDIVHTRGGNPGLIGRLAAKHCNVKAIVHTYHGHVFHSYFGKLKTRSIIQTERWLAGISSGIIAISDIQKHELVDTYRICSKEKIRMIPLGFDLEKFSVDTVQKRFEFRQRFQIDENEVAIGLIARIVPIKNHLFFVQVAKKILSRASQKVRFFIIGDGDLRPEMEDKISQSGMTYSYFPESKGRTDITCTSWITEIDYAMAGLDIVALTSNNEGTPVSLIEAQAASKPVISTEVGGVADIIVRDQSGFLVPPIAIDSYVEQLLKLIESPDLRSQMGEVGSSFVQSRFSRDRLLRDMSEYYHLLLKK